MFLKLDKNSKLFPIITRELNDDVYSYYLFNKVKIFEKKYNKETEARRLRRKEHKRLSKQKFYVENYYTEDYLENQKNVILLTISFNNPIIVDYQINLIKKFITGSYIHIICDNSNKQESAEKIREKCVSNNITYIRVDSKIIPNGYSDSHGVALNWVWENVLKPKQKDFGLLDHDILPVCEQNVEDIFHNQDIYGQLRSNNKIGKHRIWYLWPGFSFFRFSCLKDLKLNFRRYKKFGFIKTPGVDTGSANWGPLYSRYDVNTLKMCDVQTWDIKRDCLYDKELTSTSNFNDCIEYYNDHTWLHAINGSDWHLSNGKINLVYEKLNDIMSKQEVPS